MRPLAHHHPVALGAPRAVPGAGGAPLLLQRSDDDFLEATLSSLRSAAGCRELAALRADARNRQGTLKLFQPIQRQFHVALLEAWCDAPGTPRLDPAKVLQAGLVLRRVAAAGGEGWMRADGRVRGWLPLARLGGADADPLAARRLLQGRTGSRGVDQALQLLVRAEPDHALDEDVIPLYVAPPDVCAEAGRTLLYGIVPTTSGELAEAPPVLGSSREQADFGADSAVFREHLVEALRGQEQAFPFAGSDAQGWWFGALESLGDTPPEGVSGGNTQWQALRNAGSAEQRSMRRFVMLLRQLALEFGAFDASPESAALAGVLRDIRLPLVRRQGDNATRSVPAFDFLKVATRRLLSNEVVTGVHEMPERWPALDGPMRSRLAAALHATLAPRFAALKGKAGRFDEPGARYTLRAFVRVAGEGGCPDRLLWSAPSEPFVIAAWYEGAGAPPVQIALPDPSDRELLKSLKPNVAFTVPPSIANLLNGPVKDLMEGKGSTGSLGITWVCSFSIPIITICAFIVLNIFLSLLNIVFGWMFFLKICLPLPKFGNRPPGSSGGSGGAD